MKKIWLFICVAILATTSLMAQNKQVEKMKKLYEQQKYDDCITKSDEYIKEYPSVLEFPAYSALSAFQLYKVATTPTDKNKYINLVLRNINRALPKNKNNQLQSIMNEHWPVVQAEIKKLGDEWYSAGDNEKAAYYYDYYARFYADTTDNYRQILNPKQETDLVVRGKSRAEIDFEALDKSLLKNLNQTDAQGRKQGLWIKFYSADGTMVYKVTFKDGSPIGDYKRYHANGALMADMFYSESGYASAKLYDENNQLLASGFYKGIIRDSVWTYHYGENLLLAEERYTKGVLNGKSKSYFENGTVAEESSWVNGVQHGIWRQYFPDGKVKFETKMAEGKRQGVFYGYFPSGIFEIKGQYKDDLRHGKWQYYNTQGVVVREENYIDGRLETDIQLENMKNKLAALKKQSEESKGLSIEEMTRIKQEISKLEADIKTMEDNSKDEIENKELLELEKNKGKILDPEKYINNPLDYFQNRRSGGN